MTYPKVSHTDATTVASSPRFPAIEEAVLAYWESDDTFRASVEQRDAGADGSNEFVFYDGPPFANGLPHYGHLLTGYVKDLIPRYQTMRGHKVERRFGWDTHGLPAELEAMRLNGIKTTDEIVELGIEKFNEACRQSVLKYTGEWRDYVTRQARWVDFDNDYRTMNPEFMESVIWAFKQLHEKGLVYEGFRVLPYCWQDETPLSNHELRMDDDVYQMRQDPAVTVGYDVTTDGPFKGVKVLVWTTTPWTLPSNLAVMVGEDIDYVVVESDGPTGSAERYLLAEARVASYARELGRRARRSPGAARAPTSSAWSTPRRSPTTPATSAPSASCPPSSSRPRTAPGWCTPPAPSVRTTRSSPTARASRRSCRSARTGASRSRSPTTRACRSSTPTSTIIDHLKAATKGEQGGGSVTPGTVLVRRETYDHSYPHCWRCRQPLIYKGVSSWFVEVTKVKERLMALNQDIRWVPEHIKDGQFGKWLENARDWSITRNRFWGSPVPVWKSDDEHYPRVDVYGSFEEIERDFGTLPRDKDGNPDLHRPFVDELTRPNPDDPTGKSTMRRVTDVLDVWFDSGSMSLRAGALPVREQGLVRQPLPRRLHRRVHRPDPRLVLHDARPGGRDLRPPGVLDVPEPRHRARQRRPEDVEVAAQLPRRARGLRPRRRRRDALVPHVEPDPARRQPRRHRAGHPRLGAAGADPAVEQLVVLQPVRQRGQAAARATTPRGAPTARTRWTATSWPSCATTSPR